MASTSLRRDRRHQDVAGAAHGLDDLRLVAVLLDLLAQPPDLDVDRAVERPRLAAARVLEQEVAREDAASVLDEHREKLELAAGERYFATLGVEQATRRDVELPLGKPVPRPRRFCGPRRRGERSAQHRLDAGQELAQVERLG